MSIPQSQKSLSSAIFMPKIFTVGRN